MALNVGDRAVITVTFTDATGAGVAPTTVTLRVRRPDRSVLTVTMTAGTPAGTYTAAVDLDQAGEWAYSARGTGAYVGAHDGTFVVGPDPTA